MSDAANLDARMAYADTLAEMARESAACDEAPVYDFREGRSIVLTPRYRAPIVKGDFL